MKVKAKVLKDFIKAAMNGELSEWISMPMKVDNPTEDQEAAVIQPAADTQVSDITNLPIGDDKWKPGNLKELGMAMKQISQHVPESQIQYAWIQIKKIVDKALDSVDPMSVEPKVADIGTGNKPQTVIKSPNDTSGL